MDIRNFYDEIGSDVNDVEKRLGSLETAKYFVKKFQNDKTYSLLTEAYGEDDNGKAFRAAHTLKGLCSNLGFDALYTSAAALTEALRSGRPLAGTEQLYEAVKTDYEKLISAIDGVE